MKTAPTPEDLATLHQTYLFSGLEDASHDLATIQTSVIQIDAGQTLFRQGELAEACFWVKQGLIRLSRISPQGDEKVIDLVNPGHYFAEAVMFMGNRYPVNAVAQSASVLIAIDGKSFRAWLSQDVERCFRLISGMSVRLHRMVNEIDRLTLMKGMDRLMQYLVDHSEPGAGGRRCVQLGAPKQVIASRIGVKPETLSRLLHKLVDLGHIEMEGQRVRILDVGAMTQSIGRSIDD